MVHFIITDGTNTSAVSPEYIGSCILTSLRNTALANLSVAVNRAVMSVPAEFSDLQRNYTRRAAGLAGMSSQCCHPRAVMAGLSSQCSDGIAIIIADS